MQRAREEEEGKQGKNRKKQSLPKNLHIKQSTAGQQTYSLDGKCSTKPTYCSRSPVDLLLFFSARARPRGPQHRLNSFKYHHRHFPLKAIGRPQNFGLLWPIRRGMPILDLTRARTRPISRTLTAPRRVHYTGGIPGPKQISLSKRCRVVRSTLWNEQI